MFGTPQLEAVFAALDWPHPTEVWEPTGPAALALARTARDKIERPLQRKLGTAAVRVGVLTAQPGASDSQPLLALICVFERPASQACIRLAHSLAWNFNRTKLLITIEPHVIRSWTCWERPRPDEHDQPRPVSTEPIEFVSSSEDAAARALHIVYLTTGTFFQLNDERFQIDQRADQLLLSNLSSLRTTLITSDLPVDIAHDLIARLIFIQFLHQRLDAAGKPALGEHEFEELVSKRILSPNATSLAEVLTSKRDTYALFRWLNDRFNGDLFPGKGTTQSEREEEWRTEMQSVTQSHLTTLADFISGELRLGDGQRSLWPLYSFDTIPLEIISSIYEQFVGESLDSVGAHYTPSFIVDFILDRVLPWNGNRYDLTVLDPSCGSGIFLVKAFQRLVARWRNQHSGSEPPIAFLLQLLEQHLFGVDINPHAIRVASFSLYLALCEEIDPRQLWRDMRFPRLRDKTLIARDYFSISPPCLADLIVGNAPWGKDSLTTEASNWATENSFPIENKQIGTLFLGKAAQELSSNGQLSLLQPAAAILFNRRGRASAVRRAVLSRLDVLEVVDFSALRFAIFPNSTSPVALVTARAGVSGNALMYVRPRSDQNPEADLHLLVEPTDVHEVTIFDFLNEPWLVGALAWGGGRAASLMRRLVSQARGGFLITLADLKKRDNWTGREGYKRGDGKKLKPHLASGTHKSIQVADLGKGRISGSPPANRDPCFHSRDSTDDSLFSGPLLLLGKGWSKKLGFRASIFSGPAIFPASSIFGLRFPPEESYLAHAACCVANSKFAEWFLTISSARASSYRPEVGLDELLRLPIGPLSDLRDVRTDCTTCDSDALAAELLNLNDVDEAIIDDFVNVYHRDHRAPEERKGSARPSVTELQTYCEFFLRVLSSGVGADSANATIFEPPRTSRVDLRVTAIHFGKVETQHRITTVELEQDSKLLVMLNYLQRRSSESHNRLFTTSNIARVFHFHENPYNSVRVPTAYFVKPNSLRHWTRTAALSDADATIADVLHWKLSSA